MGINPGYNQFPRQRVPQINAGQNSSNVFLKALREEQEKLEAEKNKPVVTPVVSAPVATPVATPVVQPTPVVAQPQPTVPVASPVVTPPVAAESASPK